ncbi:PfkB family carbohydrate kinase [Alphaproteobacteria bacterium]|nr:PfkB family carbohydrate kinase [Alphaproteobacteria bacterium]
MKILVIGDTIIDHEINAIANGVSLETPTLKGNFINERYFLGGAAAAARHLSKLGAQVTMISATSERHSDLFCDGGVDLINVDGEFSCMKSRIWLEHGDASYKIVQINKDNAISEDKVLRFFSGPFDELLKDTQFDRLLVSDYRRGMLSKEIYQKIRSTSVRKIGASQLSTNTPNYQEFLGFDLVVCNEAEAKHIPSNMSDVCITLGKNGCIYKNQHYGTKQIEVKNTVGAGDAFLAAFTYSDNPDFANKYASEYLQGKCND